MRTGVSLFFKTSILIQNAIIISFFQGKAHSLAKYQGLQAHDKHMGPNRAQDVGRAPLVVEILQISKAENTAGDKRQAQSRASRQRSRFKGRGGAHLR